MTVPQQEIVTNSIVIKIDSFFSSLNIPLTNTVFILPEVIQPSSPTPNS